MKCCDLCANQNRLTFGIPLQIKVGLPNSIPTFDITLELCETHRSQINECVKLAWSLLSASSQGADITKEAQEQIKRFVALKLEN